MNKPEWSVELLILKSKEVISRLRVENKKLKEIVGLAANIGVTWWIEEDGKEEIEYEITVKDVIKRARECLEETREK